MAAITDFINAYNAVAQFQADQNARDYNNKYLKTAILYDSDTLNYIND